MTAPVTRWYRRPPGAGWLAASIVVPLAIGLIGWTGAEPQRGQQALPGASSSAAPADLAAPEVMLAPFSLRRKADDVILSGQLSDQASVAFALDLARTQLPGTTVLDMLTPIPGVTAADLTGLDAVLAAGAALSDFGFSIEGGEVMLFGTAPSDATKLELEEAVRAAWPDLDVRNDIEVPSAAPAAPPAPR